MCGLAPTKSLLASGSKDNQQPIKLWDPKSGTSLATIHAHKATVMELKWNKNGNWLLTASRDHLLKVFDIRNMKEEIQTFKGHKKKTTAVAWHPIHEGLFVSGGSDGAVMFWNMGLDREVGSMEEAHEGMVWSLAWHPMGHILAGLPQQPLLPSLSPPMFSPLPLLLQEAPKWALQGTQLESMQLEPRRVKQLFSRAVIQCQESQEFPSVLPVASQSEGLLW